MGGIKAGQSRTFDLTQLQLPEKNGAFLVRAASYNTYTSRGIQIEEKDVIYTGLVVYNTDDPSDKTNLNIFAGVSDNQDAEYIYVTNQSKFVLELRLDSPTGMKLATLAPAQTNKKLFLKPLDDGLPYSFYATYVYIDPETNEIRSFATNDFNDRQRRIPSREGVNPMVFLGPKDTSDISYMVAFVRIKNDINEGFNFRDGTEMLADQKGRRYVASGELQTFELAALSGDQGQVYSNLQFEFDDTEKNFAMKPSVSLKKGFVYDVIISEKDDGRYGWDIRETAYQNKLENMRMSLFFGD
jgi:hypothetical protein